MSEVTRQISDTCVLCGHLMIAHDEHKSRWWIRTDMWCEHCPNNRCSERRKGAAA